MGKLTDLRSKSLKLYDKHAKQQLGCFIIKVLNCKEQNMDVGKMK